MMATIGLVYLALFALAARMQRHRPLLLGVWQKKPFVPHLELAGWTLLSLSLASLWLWQDTGMALVAWVGLLPLLGGIIVLGMTYRPTLPRVGVAVSVAFLLLGLLP